MATPTLVQTITHDRPGDRVGFRTPWQEVPDGR